MASITLDKLRFRYPGSAHDTLHDLSLDIADGEAHALLGASGSGKTTLLSLLSGLLTPGGGELRFDGSEVSGASGRQRNVAQVFQFPVLYDALTVADNLAFPLKVRGATSADTQRRVERILGELEIEHLSTRKPGTLPLFEKQLVAVGKALVRPDVSAVLLDEPLTAVEPRVKWRLRQALRKVHADLNVTMIYVTHDQTEALTFADRVSVLADGRLLQSGTPEDLYATPAHEFVGHFVGSPGMNFIPSTAIGVSDCERIGFRPEWATLGEQGGVSGTVSRVRIEGTLDDAAVGVTTLSTRFGELSVRGVLTKERGASASVHIERYLAFTDGHRVEARPHV